MRLQKNVNSLAYWKEVRAAANGGDADAAFLLASAYEDGVIAPSGEVLVCRDTAQALHWCRCAAESGDPCAQLQLGNMLSEGVGCGRDTAAALLWYKRSLRGGYDSAANNIAVLYRNLGNERRAVFWFLRASALGDSDALVEFGKALHTGVGIRRDQTRAVVCFRDAYYSSRITEASREEAAYCLGIAYRDGAGVKKSAVRAVSWLRKAVESGDHSRAARALASLTQ